MRDSDWDDDELVSPSDLRMPLNESPRRNPNARRAQQPQRRAAAPRGSRSAQPARQQPARQQPARQQQARPQPRQAAAGRTEAPRSQGQPPRRPPQQGGSANLPATQAPRRRQAPAPPARRDEPRRTPRPRPQGERQFADKLAASDRVGPSSNVSGWRSAVLKATGGVVNLGPSAQDRELERMHKMIRRPVTDGTVAVFSRKGGVGKTTISAYLGLTLAVERGGRIVSLDGDAEAGSLGWLLAPRAPSTLAALASAAPTPASYGELRRYTTTTPEGLEVIVGEPAEQGPISTTGLEGVASQLSRHYDVSIFDTGAGVTRATGRVLVNTARTLLLVMSPSADSVRAAERTLAWLEESPEAMNPDANVIAVINGIPSSAKPAHVERIESHFAERCSAVVRIPWDAHLATGSSNVSLDLLSKQTRQGFLELAATTVSTLARRSNGRNGHMGARRAS